MKTQVLYIHGGDAFSKYDDYLNYLRTVPLRNLPGKEAKVFWSSTLAEDLGPEYEVYTPTMPNKVNASYEEWSIWFERHFPYLKDGVILVGWSLGGMFLAKYLAEKELPFKPKKLILLAAPCGSYDDGKGNDCGTFQFDPAILPEVTNKVEKITLFHSADDFVVDYSALVLYREAWPKAVVVAHQDKNHYLVEKLPELLAQIKEV